MTDITQEPYYQDWKTVLIPRIRETEAWADMFDAISDVFARNIYKYIYLLRYIRDPIKQEKTINIQQAEFLGFKYKSDLFTESEYANLVYFLSYYNKYVKGTQDFINFIGWIKNAKFKLVQLWAKGHYNYSDDPTLKDPFERESSMVVRNNSMVEDTGTQEWYPTSHVDIEYNAEEFSIDESDIWYLFYKCAPINLILRAISAVFTADIYNLNFNLAINNHTNTHDCMPCIYQKPASFYLSTDQASESTNIEFLSACYGNKINRTITDYYPFWTFDNKCIAQDLLSNSSFIFTRDSVATNIERGTIRLSIVPLNYPRFFYAPETRLTHNLGKGLLIEEKRSNLLLDSSNPIERQLYLIAGSYTFSGLGRYEIRNLTSSRLIAEVEDGEVTFTLSEDSKIQIEVLFSDNQSWFQLEFGNFATSYIPTDSMTQETREADILKMMNLPQVNNSGTFDIEFSIDKPVDGAILLKVFESSSKYAEIKKFGDRMLLTITGSKQTFPVVDMPYTGFLAVSSSPNQIIVNGNKLVFDYKDGISPKYCYIGQENGKNSINGYIKSFIYFPTFVNF